MKIVFLTGAGISAESGLSTFRDSDGLWDKYRIEDVCTDTAMIRNPELVHEFYNARRRELLKVEPNYAHRRIAELLAEGHDVRVVTQNVDNLHERAGMPSDRIIHLHGELMKVRSLNNPSKIFTLTKDNLDTTPQTRIEGEPVRPHIVFFGEAVPMLEPAIEEVSDADVLVIVGTSMKVYPAAALYRYAKPGAKIYYIDPNPAEEPASVTVIAETATEGMRKLKF